MLIRFLVVSVIKYKIVVRTVFCPHAHDSEPESMISHCVSCMIHNQTGLVGEKCSQKLRMELARLVWCHSQSVRAGQGLRNTIVLSTLS